MVLPAQMTLIETDGSGPPEVMKLATGPLPLPKPDEVLIRVLAAGVNRPDIAQRQGSYPPPPGASPILGLEVVGRGRRGRKRGHQLEGRRPRVRADQWRRLRRILHRAGVAMFALAQRL